MPNKIYIQTLFRSSKVSKKDSVSKQASSAGKSGTSEMDDVLVFPLQDDVTMDVGSEFSSWSEMFPAMNILSTLQTANVASSASVNQSLLNFSSMMDSPRWTKTRPIQITVNLGFYLVDDPYENIYKPMKNLIGMTILSYKASTKTLVPPGLFLPAAAKTQSKASGSKSSQVGASAKLIALKIPGVIFLPVAIIKQATPIYSQHLTSNGWPLWGSLELVVEGLYPAREDFFLGDNSGEFKVIQDAEEDDKTKDNTSASSKTVTVRTSVRG